MDHTVGSYDESCIVGYALNKKKLRKSGAAVSDATDNDINKGVDRDSTQTNSHLSSPQSQHQHLQWRGGGLADLLSDKYDTRVRFQPIDFDMPMEEQPFFHVIIHKLTEDIRVQDTVVESKANLQFLSDYQR